MGREERARGFERTHEDGEASGACSEGLVRERDELGIEGAGALVVEDEGEDRLAVVRDESLRERRAPGDEVEERARRHLDGGDGALDEAGSLEAADRALSRFGTPLGHPELVGHGSRL